MKRRWISAFLAVALLVGIAAGSTALAADEGEKSILSELLSSVTVLAPSAPGTSTQKNSSALIDYSNAADGYIMVKWTGSGSPKLKVRIKGPSCPDYYDYDLRTDGEYEVFPLSDGNGKYNVVVYKNISGDQYSSVLSAKVEAKLTDEFAPFLRPNQYVNFSEDSNAVAKAAELCEGVTENLRKVEKVYDFVVGNLTYDTAKAKNPPKGYVPDIDEVLETKKGICFDYASLMAAMLRSQGVPVKLVFGHTSGGQYHAWINVWSEDGGWVDSMIYFDGRVWKLMDPTYASSGKQSASIMKFIGDAKNYKEKFLY